MDAPDTAPSQGCQSTSSRKTNHLPQHHLVICLDANCELNGWLSQKPLPHSLEVPILSISASISWDVCPKTARARAHQRGLWDASRDSKALHDPPDFPITDSRTHIHRQNWSLHAETTQEEQARQDKRTPDRQADRTATYGGSASIAHYSSHVIAL